MSPIKIDRIATVIILGISTLIGVLILSLLGYLLITGLPNISWHFITSQAESFNRGGGIRDQLFNSVYLLFLTMIVSVPLALCAAIYLSAYAPQKLIYELNSSSHGSA